MTTTMYLDFIRHALSTEGIDVADTANKLALEMRAISIDQYIQASRILVDAILAR